MSPVPALPPHKTPAAMRALARRRWNQEATGTCVVCGRAARKKYCTKRCKDRGSQRRRRGRPERDAGVQTGLQTSASDGHGGGHRTR